MAAWIFPGQGSQFRGMASGLRGRAASDVFASAERILGWDVVAATRDASDESLLRTEVAQPALFTVSVAAARTLADRGVPPSLVAGHSVGEFAALVAARALSFEDGLRVVVARAEAMARAGRERPGGMAAILGLPLARVAEVCAPFEPDVVVANVNAPDQIVISGERAALERCCDAMRAAGARRIVRLAVGIAAHSPMMEPARRAVARALERAVVRSPDVPFVSGATGAPHTRGADLASVLASAVTDRVRWVDCVKAIERAGERRLIEVGPGRVLSGLVRHMDRSIVVDQAGTDDEIAACADTVGAAR